jgi:hypothetical protein
MEIIKTLKGHQDDLSWSPACGLGHPCGVIMIRARAAPVHQRAKRPVYLVPNGFDWVAPLDYF